MSTSSRFQSRLCLSPKVGEARLVTVNNNNLNNNAGVKHKKFPDAPKAVETRPSCLCAVIGTLLRSFRNFC